MLVTSCHRKWISSYFWYFLFSYSRQQCTIAVFSVFPLQISRRTGLNPHSTKHKLTRERDCNFSTGAKLPVNSEQGRLPLSNFQLSVWVIDLMPPPPGACARNARKSITNHWLNLNLLAPQRSLSCTAAGIQ